MTLDSAVTVSPVVGALSQLDEGEAGIVRVVTAEDGTRRHLAALGFVPGATVSVRRKLRSGSLLVRLKGADLAIGRDVARGVWVVPMVAG
jgi:DtxR family Mn-dependent transcriptional regulator